MYRLGLIGEAVEQSKSPDIHHHLLNEAGLTGQYHLFSIKPTQIEETLNQMRDGGFKGFNVTVPYKEAIIPYLDRLEDSAAVMQSVNTVNIKDGELVGYNTDGVGYVESLYRTYPNWYQHRHENTVLVLGAGGAAKGVIHALLKHQINKVIVANRTYTKAETLAQQFDGVEAISMNQVDDVKPHVDLILNTTRVGMTPNDHELVISLDRVPDHVIISDIIYQPTWTPLLKEAKERGHCLLFGESMLYYQAVKAFEIWTNES
ncbi:shikimate dehydrogenase [Alkalibacillus flavidus]|uniref:Shikimate dehydrogenase (NADP(+)) n=1 Tax=Alkalibacillus flavidus TaxID=546021 RepID=A0ABV2KSC0_9BACI